MKRKPNIRKCPLEVGDVVFVNTGSDSAEYFDGSGPFLVTSISSIEEETHQWSGDKSFWVDLTHLDGSRCAKIQHGIDAKADDCRKDVFLTEAHRANRETPCPPSKS